MFGITNYQMFFTSCVILALIPGSDTFFVLGQSISNDRKTGVLSTLGIGSGILVHTLLATFGLSLILKNSQTAFNLVKLIGALYLIYLGIKSFREKGKDFTADLSQSKTNLKKSYFQGIITNVFNPKIALFFLAFLPQFVSNDATNSTITFFLLGSTYFVVSTIWLLILTTFVSVSANFLKKKKNFSTTLNKVSGSIFILLGAKLLTAKLD